MPVEHREGDLFAQPDVKAVGHGVNTKGVMGAGIAVLFRRKYPDMYRQYVLWCDTGLLKPGTCLPWETKEPVDNTQFIFNIASQNEPGADASETWLASGLDHAIQQCRKLGIDKLAVPRIAAGIGGLTWDQVKTIFERVVSYHGPFTLVVVSLPGADS
jgi:O-acetyl-ADP-ribose deacetylase (regulator of RNase III)